MALPIIFYSNKCQWSGQLVETVKMLHREKEFDWFLIEDIPRADLPTFLKKCPTMWLKESNTVLSGLQSISQWLGKPVDSRNAVPKGANLPAAAVRTAGPTAPTADSGDYVSFDSATGMAGLPPRKLVAAGPQVGEMRKDKDADGIASAMERYRQDNDKFGMA